MPPGGGKEPSSALHLAATKGDAMQLRTVRGRLTLGSVYKLFVAGWLVSWSLLVGLILTVLVLITVATGEMLVNGVMVHGTWPVLRSMLPMLVLFPIVIVGQAFMFGGMLTLGVWLYQLRRPLLVVADEDRVPA
jgi:uncharacterized membrane protein